jgi:hypothetical protein
MFDISFTEVAVTVAVNTINAVSKADVYRENSSGLDKS